MPKQIFPTVIQLIEMLKAIEVEFKTKKFLIQKWVILINRYSCEKIFKILEGGMQKIFQMKQSPMTNNYLTLVGTIFECYKGGYNAIRKTVITHCMNLISSGVYSQRELEEINYWNNKLEMVSNWEPFVRQATRCRFLYWHRGLFPYFFKEIVEDRHRLNQMNYFLMALKDPIDMLAHIKHLSNPQIAIDNFKKEIYEQFTKHVVLPICQKSENDLRSQIHCILIPNLN